MPDGAREDVPESGILPVRLRGCARRPHEGEDHPMSIVHTLRDVVVLCGSELDPWRCSRFSWSGDTVAAIDRVEPARVLENGALVVIPGLYNSHTHMGDS